MVDPYKKPSRRRKQKLYRRQNGKCGICGETMKMKDTSIDHILPRSFGGNNTLENIRLTHKKCNHNRGVRLAKGEIDWECVSELLITPFGQQIKWRDLYIKKLESVIEHLKFASPDVRDWIAEGTDEVLKDLADTKERLKKDAERKALIPRDYRREKGERSGRPVQSRITQDPEEPGS